MSIIREIIDKYLWKARVRNYSSKILWVIETTTKKEGFKAIAHQLLPGMKSPKNIDADGFRRVDGGGIEGHKAWWKIQNCFQAYIVNSGRGIKSYVIPWKNKVSIDEFGKNNFL